MLGDWLVRLRENHSGMETAIGLLALDLPIDTLRENHSGMETSIPALGRSDDRSCVRTIVVWKLLLSPTNNRSLYMLRENHSGMETTCLV